ncbi:hypothetical protein [Vibrio sonorensis]|uniref:hypothetical protein n=1 Tax=Vibrio sonorensis TaxID=1004316 RepID=UPI0008DA1312|nr:hypothetical protein [Vibrio sonorensis]
MIDFEARREGEADDNSHWSNCDAINLLRRDAVDRDTPTQNTGLLYREPRKDESTTNEKSTFSPQRHPLIHEGEVQNLSAV